MTMGTARGNTARGRQSTSSTQFRRWFIDCGVLPNIVKDATNLDEKELLRERLFEKRDLLARGRTEHRPRVARHIEHRQSGAKLLDPGCNFFTEHQRHDHIGQEQVDHSRVTFDQGNRLGAVRTRQYNVAIARKDPPHHVSQSVLVFNDKNRLGPVEIASFSGGRTDCRSPVGGREQYSTGRPDTGFGVELDLPTGLNNDSEHRRQSEAGALAEGLGREERLKDVVEYGLLHARAGVTYSHPDVVTR